MFVNLDIVCEREIRESPLQKMVGGRIKCALTKKMC
jgi:hypothetical protein